MLQCEIHQGKTPATNPGASSRKSIEPRMADGRRIFPQRRFIRWDHSCGRFLRNKRFWRKSYATYLFELFTCLAYLGHRGERLKDSFSPIDNRTEDRCLLEEKLASILGA